MEKVGGRQCASGATRSHSIPFPSKGGSKIQREQAHAWHDRTPGNQRRQWTTTTFTQADKAEKRKEVKQCSPTRTRSPADKLW